MEQQQGVPQGNFFKRHTKLIVFAIIFFLICLVAGLYSSADSYYKKLDPSDISYAEQLYKTSIFFSVILGMFIAYFIYLLFIKKKEVYGYSQPSSPQSTMSQQYQRQPRQPYQRPSQGGQQGISLGNFGNFDVAGLADIANKNPQLVNQLAGHFLGSGNRTQGKPLPNPPKGARPQQNVIQQKQNLNNMKNMANMNVQNQPSNPKGPQQAKGPSSLKKPALPVRQQNRIKSPQSKHRAPTIARMPNTTSGSTSGPTVSSMPSNTSEGSSEGQ